MSRRFAYFCPIVGQRFLKNVSLRQKPLFLIGIKGARFDSIQRIRALLGCQPGDLLVCRLSD